MASIIYLYDILTFKNKDKNGMLNMEEIGVGAASLTIKFVFGRKKEIVKILQYFEENFDMNLDINNIEIICLKYINYYLPASIDWNRNDDSIFVDVEDDFE